MAICPKDLKPCCDDLCRGSMRCFECGESMMVECAGCGNLVAIDGTDADLCTCDPGDDYLDYEPQLDDNRNNYDANDGTEGSG